MLITYFTAGGCGTATVSSYSTLFHKLARQMTLLRDCIKLLTRKLLGYNNTTQLILILLLHIPFSIYYTEVLNMTSKDVHSRKYTKFYALKQKVAKHLVLHNRVIPMPSSIFSDINGFVLFKPGVFTVCC